MGTNPETVKMVTELTKGETAFPKQANLSWVGELLNAHYKKQQGNSETQWALNAIQGVIANPKIDRQTRGTLKRVAEVLESLIKKEEKDV